jgi:hypothetical protein
MENRLSGFISKYMGIVTYQLAEKNKLPHGLNREDQLASPECAIGLLNRHPETPQCQLFFNLCDQINKHKFGTTKSIMVMKLDWH